MSWLMRHPTVLFSVSLALLLLGAAGLVAWFVLRPVPIRVPDTLPAGFPQEGFSHAAFEELLGRFVDAGGEVDYAGWAGDAEAKRKLDAYLAALARFSPENAPARFPTDADELAYWLNGYNACVIKGVLRHWPIQSVRDVKAPIDVVSGLAFFGTLQFVLGGEAMTLHHLEHGIIRARFPDPRAHFVLNCASGGCPVLRPELPQGDALEPYLAKAASEFVADAANVRIDHAAKTLQLSKIFEWYRDDFIKELERRGLPPAERTLLAYLLLVADGPTKAELERAKEYTVSFLEYDWGINAVD